MRIKLQAFLALLFWASLSLIKLQAQCNPTISPSVANPLPAGTDCKAVLNWGTVTANVASPCSVVGTPFFLSAVSGATTYAINDMVPAGTDVVVTYSVNINDGTVTFPQNLTFTVQVRDVSPPVLTGIPPTLTVNSCALNNTPPTITDNCSTGLAPMFSDAGTLTNCGGGTVVRTWKATDVAGNTGYLTQTITINPDTQIPVFTTIASDLIIDCDPATTASAVTAWLAANGNAVATDCNSITWSYLPIAPAPVAGCIGAAGAFEVTFKAKDACSNEATTKAKIISTDNFPPVVTAQAQDKVVVCEQAGSELDSWLTNKGNAVVADVCAGNNVTTKYFVNNIERTKTELLSFFTDSLAKPCQASLMIGGSPYTNVKGKMTVRFTFFDNCNNQSTSTTAVFAATDNLAPTFTTLPTNETVECDNATNINTTFTNWYNTRANGIATDGCSPTVTYRGVPDLPTALANLVASQASSCGNTGMTTVKFFARDECGNESLGFDAIFKVVDTKAPAFTVVPKDNTVNCLATSIPNTNTSDLQAFINTHGNGTATDNCSNVTWSFTWKDKLNNIGANTYPVIPSSGAGYPPCDWFVDVKFKAKDECNNQDSVTVRFAVQDKAPPVLSDLKPDITVDCNTIPSDFDDKPTATENCGIATTVLLSNVSNQGNNCIGTYKITKTWQSSDECGNTATYTRVITVIDNQPPNISGVPADVTVSCDGVPPVPKITISDGCDTKPDSVFVATTTKGTDPLLCSFYNYDITRTWTSTDKCGNSTSKSYKITVKDDIAPTFVVPANITVECFQVNTTSITGRPKMILDNCDATPKLDSADVVSAGSCNGNNTYSRTWKVTDVCNNTNFQTQTITTFDTKKPVVFGVPADITLACGNALPIVPTLTVKDSCDSNPTLVFLETNMAAACSGAGVIKRTWTATDNCGNVVSRTQNITLTDTQRPQITSCPTDITANNTPSNCDANVILKAPIVTDNCGATSAPFTQTRTAAITSPAPGNPDVIINPLVLNFTVPLNVTTSASNPTLEITLNNIDGEAPTEYFNIIGENNTSLGKTPATSTQCGSTTMNVTLTAAQVNAWGQDGTITIALTPFVPTTDPPSYGINDICTNSNVTGKLDFTAISNSNLVYQYSINKTAKITVNPIANVNRIFAVGTHQITYYVKDCSNNIDSCEYKVKVVDAELPTMTPPADRTVNLAATDCDTLLTIPVPTGMNDNCGFGTGYTQKYATDSLLTFNYNPNLLTYFANDKTFVFTGVTANAIGGTAVLSVKLNADTDAAGEHYTFLGEDNMPLGMTNFGACGIANTTNFAITAVQLNTWAADGQITIKAISNVSFPISQAGTQQGINPCNPVTANGQNDGQSYMTATLSYRQANPTFETIGSTVTPPTLLFQPNITPKVNFKIGVTVITYKLKDNAGNEKKVSYTVSVNDVTPPMAKCKNSILTVNPLASGLLSLSTADINDGSYDNCSIQSTVVTPSVFSCGVLDNNNIQTVTLTVTDIANNASSCTSNVYVLIESIKATYSLGICGNDTLKLFSNPPKSNNSFLYTWTGPNGFSSNLQNPIIPNVNAINAGTYKVFAQTLIGDCPFGTGTILEIPIDNQPNTPTITSPNPKPCTNGELILNTAPYTGKKVKYYWYKGISPTGVLIDSTTVNSYSILNPAAVAAKYYVVVKVDGCTSNASASITTNPETPPVAALTNAPIIEICEGENVTLGTATVGAGYKYLWSGPNAFTAATQFPSVITNAKPLNSGVYTLIVTSANGCESVPVATSVNVKPKPKTPQIVANGLDCEGNNISLVSNVTGVSTYHWLKPDLVSEQVTTVNSLVLNPLTNVQKGQWKLYVSNNGCNSDFSNIIDLKINPKPSVTAEYQNPACEGAPLQLNGIGPANSSFSWTGPSNFTSSAQNPIVQTSVAGTYIAVVIDQNGCSNFDDVVVDLKPRPDITAISSNAPACADGNLDVKLTPTVFPFASDYAYQWSGPNTNSTAQILTIPNATATNNGTYILQVISSFGCRSLPKSYVLDSKNKPETPVVKGSLTQNVCIGDNILLELDNANQYVGTIVSYKWTTPAGQITTTQPTLSISSSNLVNSGDYSVKVNIDGCESDLSNIKKITVNTIPVKPTVTLNSSICEGTTLLLQTTAITNATYEWIGPNNFTASNSSPTKLNATKNDQGFYKVRITLNGCTSPFSDNAYLQVNEVPSPIPVVKNSGAICLDNPNQFVTLSIDPNTAIPGATYTWYLASNNQQLSTASAALNYSITDFTSYPEGKNEFYAITTFNGCSTKASIPTAVDFDKKPNITAYAGDDIQVCDKPSVLLNAQNPAASVAGVTGVWSQIQGSSVVIVDPTLYNSTLSSLVPGQDYTLQWKISKGACKNFSFDDVKVIVNNTLVKAEAGDTIHVCAKTTVKLNAQTLPTGVTGLWTQPLTQIGSKIMNPTSSNADVTNLSPGNMYVFTWTISNASCKDYSSDIVYVFVDEPKGAAFAGSDFKACGGTEVKLNASEVAGTKGKWTSLTAGATVTSPNDANSSVKNLILGQNKFVWAISSTTCGNYSRDTVVVNYEKSVSAVNDFLTVPYKGENSFKPTANDILPQSGFTFKITTQPKHGKVTVSSDFRVTYKAAESYAGPDGFEYEICNQDCPDVCSETEVAVLIQGGDDCTIPNIITPNDDQINDAWEIPCLVGTDFAGNKVTIYNQWGDIVYTQTGYANDWKGTYNGEPLPAATYFYVVSFGVGENKTGFLIIER